LVDKLDWSLLSGPRVSRRTLLAFGAATGSLAALSQSPALAGGFAVSRSRMPSAYQGEPVPGGTLRLGFSGDSVRELDPAQSHAGTVAAHLISNLFSGLVQFDEALDLVPDLAETWEVSADGTEYRFILREGLTFHNGDPLLAEDVVYTYERTNSPELASPHANKLELIAEAVAEDDLTAVFRMSEPFAPFLAVACVRGPGRALIPVPRRVVEEMGDEQFRLTPVGSGPFMLVPESLDVGQGFEMVAFDGWYGGRPLLDSVQVQMIPEPVSQINALEAGDVDMLNVLLSTGVEQVMANDQLTALEAASTNWQSLAMNTERPPWDNVAARLAVSKAIDRQAFIDQAFFGLAAPAIGPIQPAFGWAYLPPDTVENPQGFNLEEAQQLAEEAGLAGLQPVLLSTAEYQRQAEVARLMLQEIGLDVQIALAQDTVYTEREEAGDFDMSFWGSSNDADPDDAFWNFFHSEGPRNIVGFVNPRVDELLLSSRTTPDQAERAAMFQEIQAILQEETPCAFTRHLPDRLAYHNYVQGYRPIPDVRYLETVWLDQ
ncbi:MAG: ABC transporter substrate-binding protein, partial [Thermomicrobiales bacterium]